jgi:ribosomal protein S27E
MEIHVHSQWAGQQAVCPSCSKTITIPSLPGGMTDKVPYVTTCPFCHATQSIPADVTGRVKRNCTKCGKTFLFLPDISFPCAFKLPPDRNGNLRVACPHCGRHYVLGYTPASGLIGCPECMNIFAHPDTEDQHSSIKQCPVLLPPAVGRPVPVSSPVPVAPVPLTRPQVPAPSPVKDDSDIQFMSSASAVPQSMPVKVKPLSASAIEEDEEEMVEIPRTPR